ncbi:hypothetical protein H7683_19905 [Ectopseudomonas mendocina]|uniref:DUF6395 domain-containing protein n=1 Tax=Ectopseudomonas mendocina TaxID=300 RepID=UPI001AE098B9|nr:DUF6395 domain-containing protein [Pseudomonas mendocina]QTN45226.1 hypothetical protein H7683_19905 [Pseudomonas mendocina]
MKVGYFVSGQVVAFCAEPSDEDRAFWEGRKARMGSNRAEFYLPDGLDFNIHPDAKALIALLVYGPFAAKEIELSWAVSSHFAAVVKQSFKRHISPVDASISPRTLMRDGRDSLAFSGGVDSVAALALLPEETLPIFMNRVLPEGVKKGLYRGDAALRSCETVRNSGREVIVLNNTMEFAREPVGFSVDWTNAAGAVLLSDVFGLRSVAFGMILESAFFIGHSHYSDLGSRSVYKAWAPIFDAVGLPIALPTAGVSEVVTTKIATAVSDKWYAQSCVRGTAETPCGTCFKCFRKKILDAKVSDRVLSSKHFDVAYSSKEVKRRLVEVPIHHENVLAFSIHGLRCDADHPVLSALREKTQPIHEYGQGLEFVEKFYRRGLFYVPEFLRDCVSKKLSDYAQDASTKETHCVENWEISHLVNLSSYISAQQRLEGELEGGFFARLGL